jgi:Rad3-related DNA helicase
MSRGLGYNILMNKQKLQVPKRDDILDHWNKVMPQFEPRDSQLATFEWLQSQPEDKKYFLLEMPVGGGKSPIGLTMSSWLSNGHGSSYLLTPQKILQRQYEDSFSDIFSLYGKSNYSCKGKQTNCEIGSSIKPKCENCPARSAKGRAISSPNLVLNYHLALMLFAYIKPNDERWVDKKLMVLDECHNLENILVNFGLVSINEKSCSKLGIDLYNPKSTREAYDWISESYFPKLATFISKLSDDVYFIERDSDGRRLTKDEEQVIKDHIKYTRHADVVNDLLLDGNDITENYVLVNGYNKFDVKQLYGRKNFNNFIKPNAEKFLFMSSTILNKDAYCRDLGINPDQASFFSVTSEFERERRVVVYSPTSKMNYGWDKPDRKNDRAKMINKVKKLLDLHKNESGIIHCGSFKFAEWLVQELSHNSDHIILNHNPVKGQFIKRDDIITEYMESASTTPTLLISPSITEGLDLKDDLGRFAIFVKVPYPSLGDAWIKRRMEISGSWYQRQALKEMIQGAGRICRHHDDYGITYILDASFTFLYNKTKTNVIPEWWNDGLEII